MSERSYHGATSRSPFIQSHIGMCICIVSIFSLVFTYEKMLTMHMHMPMLHRIAVILSCNDLLKSILKVACHFPAQTVRSLFL